MQSFFHMTSIMVIRRSEDVSTFYLKLFLLTVFRRDSHLLNHHVDVFVPASHSLGESLTSSMFLWKLLVARRYAWQAVGQARHSGNACQKGDLCKLTEADLPL